MFQLLDAKRVRREDLADSASDESSSGDENDSPHAELRAKLHARLASALNLGEFLQAPITAPASAANEERHGQDSESSAAQEGHDAEDAEEAFEFRLFGTAQPPVKIVIPTDEMEGGPGGEGGMLRRRPVSYYLAHAPTPAQQAEFATAAVSGEDVLRRAQQRWWGMEMPWKVTHITAQTKTKGGRTVSVSFSPATANGASQGTEKERKKPNRRPGKKKRIAMRVKAREAQRRAEEEQKSKLTKEEAMREKKKKLNRQKNQKRRAKAKEAKMVNKSTSEMGEGETRDQDASSVASNDS
ncbi:hypothetical protein SODALDRAFT_33158 [Sodiomyces alkalinus F11]|uniref:Uncharacterized protein n=1 Tax=Sodiomyces alkalinus (strain CBS 110278 / VKM F-3762 / F11) TaxID=1314773 RepID=A0A3N2Q8X1_SODAK|nr:hypothetical protein SODALDRAFT_33158 [Sodiomyces alkalinus F11]ROT43190.1 hypothetical protein SODALDRAFT_33158 [Sodiomyces alkalinus F11]